MNGSRPKCHTGTFHAEKNAIDKLKYRQNNKKPLEVSIIIARFSKTGIVGLSKCCNNCINHMLYLPIIKGYKIKNVYYTNNDGTIEKTTLNKLNLDNNKHKTRYFKKN